MQRRGLYFRILPTSVVLSVAVALFPIQAVAAMPGVVDQEGEKAAPQGGPETSGRPYHRGEGASDPKIISRVDPQYSDKARKAKFQGICVLSIIVEPDGTPSNVVVKTSLGMGLDEKAIEAVKKWRFQPAMKDGHPVRYGPLPIEISFHLR
jgi:periplasmic protein TonB